MPKRTPLRAIAVTSAAAWHAVRGVEHRLAGRHRQVEEEMIVAGDERRALRAAASLRQPGLQRRRREALEEQRRARPRCGCGTRRPCAAPARSAASARSGRACAARPASAGASVVAIHCRRSITSVPLAPKRSTLPRPSFRLRVGAVAAVGVLDDPHRHRRADDPGHRPDRAVMVAGRVLRSCREPASLRASSASPPSLRTGSRR